MELLAKELINRETLEGKELEKVFEKIGLSKRTRKVRKTTIPVPVKPVAEREVVAHPKKAPAVPKLVPKQTPAPTD